MVTLDEWAEQNAPGLREDIQCHLDNAAPEDQARLILISVRQWATEPKRSRVMTAKRIIFTQGGKEIPIAENVTYKIQEAEPIKVDCQCGEFGCLRCAP